MTYPVLWPGYGLPSYGLSNYGLGGVGVFRYVKELMADQSIAICHTDIQNTCFSMLRSFVSIDNAETVQVPQK